MLSHIYFFLDFTCARVHTHTHIHTCTRAHTHRRHRRGGLSHTHTRTRAHAHRRHRRGGLSPSSPLLLNGPLPSPPSGGCSSCNEGGGRPLTPLASSFLLHGSKNKPAGILLVVLLVVAERAVDILENDDHRCDGGTQQHMMTMVGLPESCPSWPQVNERLASSSGSHNQ